MEHFIVSLNEVQASKLAVMAERLGASLDTAATAAVIASLTLIDLDRLPASSSVRVRETDAEKD